MKKILLTIFLSLFSVIWATEVNINFNFSPFYQIRNGQMNEYVIIYDNNKNQTVDMSRLDWELKNISFFGLNAEINIFDFFLNGTFKTAISSKSGKMYDSDWLNYIQEDNDFYYIDSTMKTNYSINQNTLNYDYGVGVKLGYDFFITKFFMLAPYVAFDYDFVSFSAKNGYGYYGDRFTTGKDSVSYDDSTAIFFGKGQLGSIDYMRQSYYFDIGFLARFYFLDRFSIIFDFNIAPYAYVISKDIHYKTDKNVSGTYIDIMQGPFSKLTTGIAIEANINKFLSLLTNFEYTGQRKLTGKTLGSTSSGSASKTNWIDISFLIKISIDIK